MDSFLQAADPKPVSQERDPVLDTLRLCEITPDLDDSYISQLLGDPYEVHKVGTESCDHLRAVRLGGEGHIRTCFALIDPAENIHAAIYLYKDPRRYNKDPQSLCGSISDILSGPCEKLNGEPGSVIFYSVNRKSDIKGVGKELIRKIHNHISFLHPNSVMSTLSPLRHFNKAAEADGFASLPEPEKLQSVLRYLARQQDPVAKFHMGNGAIVADIKLDADTEGLHRVMANLFYDRSNGRLRLFAKKSETNLLVRPELLNRAGISDPAHPLRSELRLLPVFL